MNREFEEKARELVSGMDATQQLALGAVTTCALLGALDEIAAAAERAVINGRTDEALRQMSRLRKTLQDTERSFQPEAQRLGAEMRGRIV